MAGQEQKTEAEMREAMRWFFEQDENTQRAVLTGLRNEATARFREAHEQAMSEQRSGTGNGSA